jgi:hypothetical protein
MTHMQYPREDDNGEPVTLGPMITVDLEEMLERTADENGDGHIDVPDWWALESGYWVAYQAGVITHMSEDGVGEHLVLSFGFPDYSEDGRPQVLIKTISFRDDEQIAVFMAGVFGSLEELGGPWPRRMMFINKAIEDAMSKGWW